ncbi:hypothetical protein [Goodfellowiella coeruleoviolacea]|nr:hypothetical protein [Goodfellowiella coeruleoviolacea]
MTDPTPTAEDLARTAGIVPDGGIGRRLGGRFGGRFGGRLG